MNTKVLTDADCDAIIYLHGTRVHKSFDTVDVHIDDLRAMLRTAYQRGRNVDVMHTKIREGK